MKFLGNTIKNNFGGIKKGTLLLSLLVLLASCGSGGDDKKAELDKLKKEYVELGKKIKTLEAEIEKADTTKKSSGNLVATEKLEIKSFAHYIEVQGKVESEQNIGVSPQMPGMITSLMVTKGQQVSKGQVLATTDASVIAANMDMIKSNLAFATTMFEKQESLWKQGIGSEVQYLQAKTGKEGLENQLATLQQQMEMTKIKSPINGTVDDILTKIGEAVAPGFPAFRVVNMSSMKVTTDVAEAYAGKIKVGDEVIISFPDRDKEITKTITSVGRVIDPNKRSFSIEIKLSANEEEFFNPNMVAVVKVKDYSVKETFVIPVNIVQNDEEGDFVFLAETEGEKIVSKKVRIKTGLTYGGFIEVKEGLEAGDELITAGYDDLNEGQEIKMNEE